MFRFVALLFVGTVGFAADDCKYFNPVPNTNTTATYVGPGVCAVTKSGSTFTSFKYDCTSSDEVTLKYYGNATNCDGKEITSTTFKKSDGYAMNCGSNAKDCSSLYRIYTSCDTSTADYTTAPLVNNVCEQSTDVTSQMWTCTSTTQSVTEYVTSNDCSGNGFPESFSGCVGTIYYEVVSCAS